MVSDRAHTPAGVGRAAAESGGPATSTIGVDANRHGRARIERVEAVMDRHWFRLLAATAGLALGAATVCRFRLEPLVRSRYWWVAAGG